LQIKKNIKKHIEEKKGFELVHHRLLCSTTFIFYN